MTRLHIKRRSVLALLTTGVVAVAMLASVGTAGKGVSQRVLLADASLDTTLAQRREALRAFATMADLAAVEEGVIAAAAFQSNALATISWPVNHRFRPSPDAPNSYYRRLSLARQVERVKEQARALFSRRSAAPGTDVIGALLAASEFFASQPTGPRALVVASNMWEYSPGEGLILKTRPLSGPEIARMLNGLARSGRIARLRDVCVYAVGAGLDPGRQIPTSVQLSLRRFWRGYFARSGARLRAWVPTLRTDPSC